MKIRPNVFNAKFRIAAIVALAVLVVLAVIAVMWRRGGGENVPVAVWSDFLSQQKRYERVRVAISKKERLITDNLRHHGLTADDMHILITAYKAEKQLEIYAKKKSDIVYNRIAVYDVCKSSGKLGPKRMEGDKQVPEGFYRINHFNHNSSYYLSLGINYPNQADRIKSSARKLGGDIYIHGACATSGCLPMTNDKIKEIYLYAVYARNNGQVNIPVYIFPFRMTDENFRSYQNQYANNRALLDFWANLKIGYDQFMLDKKELTVSVSADGDYLFK